MPATLARIPDLVRTGQSLEFIYRDEKGTMTERTITPYGWANQRGVLYIHGLCHTREERRTFRADRIVSASAAVQDVA